MRGQETARGDGWGNFREIIASRSRQGSESNQCIQLLQSCALPLGYPAVIYYAYRLTMVNEPMQALFLKILLSKRPLLTNASGMVHERAAFRILGVFPGN